MKKILVTILISVFISPLAFAQVNVTPASSVGIDDNVVQPYFNPGIAITYLKVELPAGEVFLNRANYTDETGNISVEAFYKAPKGRKISDFQTLNDIRANNLHNVFTEEKDENQSRFFSYVYAELQNNQLPAKITRLPIPLYKNWGGNIRMAIGESFGKTEVYVLATSLESRQNSATVYFYLMKKSNDQWGQPVLVHSRSWQGTNVSWIDTDIDLSLVEENGVVKTAKVYYREVKGSFNDNVFVFDVDLQSNPWKPLPRTQLNIPLQESVGELPWYRYLNGEKNAATYVAAKSSVSGKYGVKFVYFYNNVWTKPIKISESGFYSDMMDFGTNTTLPITTHVVSEGNGNLYIGGDELNLYQYVGPSLVKKLSVDQGGTFQFPIIHQEALQQPKATVTDFFVGAIKNDKVINLYKILGRANVTTIPIDSSPNIYSLWFLNINELNKY